MNETVRLITEKGEYNMSIKFVDGDKFPKIYVKGAKLFWEKLRKPGTKYQSTEKEYSATLVISQEDVKALKKLKVNKQFKEIGMDVDEDKFPGLEGEYTFKITAPVVTSRGTPTRLAVVDKEGQPIPEDVGIGNGSTVNVRLMSWEGKGPSKGKLTVRPNLVVVTELVEYQGNEEHSDFDEELGIEVKYNSQTTDDEVFDDDDVPF